MSEQAPQQQPQVTPEMLKKLQGEKEEKKQTKSSFSNTRHWIVKMIKDIAYIAFFPYIWSWELYKKIARNKKKPTAEVNINKENNNNQGKISLQEDESQALDANTVNNCTEHESLPVTPTPSNLTT